MGYIGVRLGYIRGYPGLYWSYVGVLLGYLGVT